MLLAFTLSTMSSKAQEINISITSKHYKKGDFNELNPGLILTTSNDREWFDRGWRIGAYHNSHERLSVLVTRYFDFDIVPSGNLRIRVSYGAITGYEEVMGLKITPAATPSLLLTSSSGLGVEIFWLPGAFGLTFNLNVD